MPYFFELDVEMVVDESGEKDNRYYGFLFTCFVFSDCSS